MGSESVWPDTPPLHGPFFRPDPPPLPLPPQTPDCEKSLGPGPAGLTEICAARLRARRWLSDGPVWAPVVALPEAAEAPSHMDGSWTTTRFS
ncbi:hypothetical protein MHYP_G00225620 [Metynnis hypsauchen]